MKLFTPTDNELEGLDKLISKFPELQTLIVDNDYSLEQIALGMKKVKHVPEKYKAWFINMFKSISETHLAKEVYKFSNFKNQEIIERLLEREEHYKEIIKKQAEKHNDNEGIEEMNKVFSTMIIKTTENKKLSYYMNKSIIDIRINDDFQPIFEKPGMNEYTKEELLKMKKDRKGSTFKDVDTITILNVPGGKNIINGKVK